MLNSQPSTSLRQDSPFQLIAKDGAPLPLGHAVNDETRTDYLVDGVAVSRARDTIKIQSRHVTMIADDVVDTVTRECGLAAGGLYMKLERRVGKDSTWVSTVTELARDCGCSDRHIQDCAKRLEEAGFLQRTTITGRAGINVGVQWFLPKHARTNYGEASGEPTGEGHGEASGELSCAPVQGVSNYTVDTSSDDLVPSGDDQSETTAKPKREAPPYTEGFDEFWRAYPRKDDRKDALAIWNRIKPDAALLAQMLVAIDRQGLAKKEPKYRPLPTTWLNKERWNNQGDVPPDPNDPDFDPLSLPYNSPLRAKLTGKAVLA